MKEGIRIDKKNFMEYDTTNAVAVSFAHPGAMGCGGEVIVVTSDGECYATNYAYGDLEWEELVKFIPVIGECRFGMFGDDECPEGWNAYNMGCGNHLIVCDSIDERFRSILIEAGIMSAPELYSVWEEVVAYIVDGVDSSEKED